MLSARNISKKFAGVTALDQVSLDLYPGQINAIIGENGAGKSTLMKILSGVYRDYEGSISLDGQEVRFRDTRDAQAQGIAIIHQELNLIPDLSIQENIFLGHELTNRWGLLDQAAMKKATNTLLQQLQLKVDPTTPIRKLKVGQQQMVEIAKALHSQARIIIMDEPSSAISGAEVEVLFEIITKLKTEGKAIAYISHKMDELFRIADTYTVLRDGKSVESGRMQDVTPDHLVGKMVGRALKILNKSARPAGAEELLRVENLQISKRNSKAPIFFSLQAGEVLGVFGLMGAGRTELLEALFGLNGKKNQASIFLSGKKLNIQSPSQALQAGLALVSEDRKKDGILPQLSLKKNISITTLAQLLQSGMLSAQKENKLAEKYIQELRIKASSPEQLIQNLSGGNQQKAILAKCLATRPKVLLLDEPTRGIDVNAKAEIYQLIDQFAQLGLGVIMVSSELPEIFAVCDRVLVLCEGKLNGNFLIAEASEASLLKAAIA